jgi:hypothetical protein
MNGKEVQHGNGAGGAYGSCLVKGPMKESLTKKKPYSVLNRKDMLVEYPGNYYARETQDKTLIPKQRT